MTACEHRTITSWPVPTLRTRRLVLTPLAEADADAMVEVLADEGMYEFTGGEPPTVDRLRRRYRTMARGRSPSGDEWWFNWIVRWPTDDPVGAVQATVTADRARADVAWEVGVPWQGQGIAGEAAQAMVDWLSSCGVPHVRACIHPDHAASAAIATRIGLAPSTELIDGEVVWQSTAPERSVQRAGRST